MRVPLRWFRLSIASCVLVGALAVAPATAGAMWDTWAQTRTVAKRASASSSDYWHMPQISGNYITWIRWGDPDPEMNVWVYDIRKGTAKEVKRAWTNTQSRPRISGDWITFYEERWDSGVQNIDVFAYRISTSVVKNITNRSLTQKNPDVSGSKVVYYDVKDSSIHLYDLSASKDKVVETGCMDVAPAISGTRVAYVKYGQVWVENLSTGGVTALTSTAGAKKDLIFYGTRVAWAEHNGSNYDVWMRDLGASSNKMVAGGTGHQERPALSGSLMVYASNPSGQYLIYAYDTIAEKSVLLSTGTKNYHSPDITGLNCVWVSAPNTESSSITLGRLGAPALTISAPGSIGYNATFKVKGTLMEGDFPVAYKTVYLQSSTDGGKTWKHVASAKTGLSGTYSITTPSGIKKATQYRTMKYGLVVGGRLAGFSALSPIKTVKPKVYLGRPFCSTYTRAEDKYFTVRGTLKPRHTSGTKPVKVKVYKKVSGKYVWKKTYTASVYNYSTYSRYKASIKFTSPGRWRVRAYYPTSSTNYKTYSSYRYFTVY